MAAVRRADARSTATTVAVSILPIGGSTRRSGKTSQLVDADDGIGHRIAEVGPHQLEQQAQHERQRQQPQQRIDDVSDRLPTASFRVYGAPNSAASSAERRSAAATACATIARRPAASSTASAAAVVPPLEVTCSRKRRERFARVARHLRGAERRLQSELVRDLVRQPALMGGGFERFHEQEEIGRPAARQRGHGVHLRFMLDPDGGAHRRHDGFRQRPVRGADARRRIQTGGAEAVERRADSAWCAPPGMCGPNQRARAACGMPAATEMTSGLDCCQMRGSRPMLPRASAAA